MVEHSDEVDEIPRLKWPRRFPVPSDFAVAKASRITEGKFRPAPEGATRIATLRIHRFNPDGKDGPQMDTFRVDLDDCGPMLLDAPIWIKSRFDATLTLRRSRRRRFAGLAR
jgi:succinate dehydrogenase / fumarate reductase iron-sulfur subunit